MLDTRSNSREDTPPPVQKNCYFQRLPRLIHHSVSRAVELFVNQMQEQVNIELQGLLKQAHVLVIVELCTQAFLQRHLCTRSWNLYASHAALNEEDTDLIAGDGNVDLIPLLLRVSLP